MGVEISAVAHVPLRAKVADGITEGAATIAAPNVPQWVEQEALARHVPLKVVHARRTAAARAAKVDAPINSAATARRIAINVRRSRRNGRQRSRSLSNPSSTRSRR